MHTTHADTCDDTECDGCSELCCSSCGAFGSPLVQTTETHGGDPWMSCRSCWLADVSETGLDAVLALSKLLIRAMSRGPSNLRRAAA